MPLPIQALPKGLVSFLDLNTGGAGPGALADHVSGILDLAEFYYAFKRERILETGKPMGTVPGPFSFNTMVVPANEHWLVYAFSLDALVPIGLTFQVACCYQFVFGGGNQSLQVGPAVQNASSALASRVTSFADRIMLLPPGSIPGGNTIALSAATAVPGSGFLDFIRFRS